MEDELLVLNERVDANGTHLVFAAGPQYLRALERLLDGLLPRFSFQEIGIDIHDYPGLLGTRYVDDKHGCMFCIAFGTDELALWWWGDRYALMSLLGLHCVNPEVVPRRIETFLGRTYRASPEAVEEIVGAAAALLGRKHVAIVQVVHGSAVPEQDKNYPVQVEDLLSDAQDFLKDLDDEHTDEQSWSFYHAGVIEVTIRDEAVMVRAPPEVLAEELGTITAVEWKGQERIEKH